MQPPVDENLSVDEDPPADENPPAKEDPPVDEIDEMDQTEQEKREGAQDLTQNMQEGLKPFVCPICPTVGYMRREKMLLHLKAHHKVVIKRSHLSPSENNCPACGKLFKGSKGFDNHLRTHDPTPFRCDICNEGFFNRTGKMDHEIQCLPLSQAAGDGSIPCLVCRLYFPDIKTLTDHKVRKHPAKPVTAKTEEECQKV